MAQQTADCADFFFVLFAILCGLCVPSLAFLAFQNADDADSATNRRFHKLYGELIFFLCQSLVQYFCCPPPLSWGDARAVGMITAALFS